MEDYIVRATAADQMIRAFAVKSTDLVERAREIHMTLPVVTAALGRTLSAGAMMGSMMKGDKDLVSIIIKGDGPIGGITVTADSHGNVKGYPNNNAVDIPRRGAGKLDVGSAVGKGTLTISMDLGLREPYNGQVELQTGEIAEDLAYYFTASEQTPSAVGLGVMVDTDGSVKHAGGFIIQLMPDASEEVISALEQKLSGIEPVTTMLDQGMSPEDILTFILGDCGLEFTDKQSIRYRCDCSRERVERALFTLSNDDLNELIEGNEDLEIKCYFCNTAYTFTVDEIKERMSAAEK